MKKEPENGIFSCVRFFGGHFDLLKDVEPEMSSCKVHATIPQYLPKFRGYNLPRVKNELGPFLARIFAKLSYPMPKVRINCH